MTFPLFCHVVKIIDYKTASKSNHVMFSQEVDILKMEITVACWSMFSGPWIGNSILKCMTQYTFCLKT